MARAPRLTPAQKAAIGLLVACEGYADGWGMMISPGPSVEQDGQAWIYFRTALALERRGLVELDTLFGRVRLKERNGIPS